MSKDHSSVDLGKDFMAHYGVKGMHWGIRRDRETGVRPIAKAFDESVFGRLANANANRYMRRQNTKAAARGDSGPKKSTSNKPDRKTINRNAAIDAARAAGVNPPKTSKPPRRALGYNVDKATLKRDLPGLSHPIDRIRYLNEHRTTANKALSYGLVTTFAGLSFYAAMNDTTIIGMGRDFIRNIANR